MTIERPMFPPVDPLRRRFIAVAAGASIVSVGSLAAAATPSAAPEASSAPVDPIYAAIEMHLDRVKAYDAAWEVRGNFEDFGLMTEDDKAQIRKLDDATDAAHLPLEAAALDLIDTVPTTQAGIIAALRYIQIQHSKGGEHMVEGWWTYEDGSERDIDWLDNWLKTLIASVSALGRKGGQS